MRVACILLLAGATAAASPTTRPRDIAPAVPPTRDFIAGVHDTSRPAFVPAFTGRPGPSALQIERDHAYRHMPPVIGHWGYGAYAPCLAPYGAIGWYPNHGFYR